MWLSCLKAPAHASQQQQLDYLDGMMPILPVTFPCKLIDGDTLVRCGA